MLLDTDELLTFVTRVALKIIICNGYNQEPVTTKSFTFKGVKHLVQSR